MSCVVIAFKMTERVEQQICITFCVELEHSLVETIRMLQKAFKDDALSECRTNKSVTQTLQRVSRFCLN